MTAAGLRAPLSDLAEVPIRLDRKRLADDVRRLSKLDPTRALLAIARQWIVIAAAWATAMYSGHWEVYAVAIVVIGTRQHALGILMHDGAHYRLLRSRRMNNLVSDWFLGFPLVISTSLYRATHFAHHRWVNTDKDPDKRAAERLKDWHWPRSKASAAWVLLRDALGLGFGAQVIALRWNPYLAVVKRLIGGRGAVLEEHQAPLSRGELISLALWTAGVAGALSLTGAWLELFLLWIVPYITVTVLIAHIRGLAEHIGVPDDHELNATRHVQATWLERLLLAPLNVNYHLAHHLFPSVPFYRLPELQRLLEEDEEFRLHALRIARYLGFRSPETSVLASLTTSSEPERAPT